MTNDDIQATIGTPVGGMAVEASCGQLSGVSIKPEPANGSDNNKCTISEVVTPAKPAT